MPRTKDLTEGSPVRLIALFALPILAEGALQQFYSLVDSAVLGRAEGVAALAAVSASGWLDWGVLSIAMGLSQGIAVQVSQSFGADRREELRLAAGQGLLLSLLLLALLMPLSQLALTPLLRLMNTPEDTFALTRLYLRIIFGGMPLVMGVNLFSGFLRAVGNSVTPLRAMVFATLANIGLDLLFVSVFRWGVAGAAAATLAAQAAALLINALAVRGTEVFALRPAHLRPDRGMLGRLLRLGAPIALGNSVIAAGGVVLSGVVNSFGFVFMAGYNAASRLQGPIELAGTAVGSALGTFTGQNSGAGKMQRVRQGVRQAAWLTTGFALVIGLCLVLWGRSIISLFVEDDPALVQQVLDIGQQFLWVMATGLPALYLLFAFRSALQGLGNSFIPMVSGFVELAMRLGAAWLLPHWFGEWGVYFAEILAWIGAAALLWAGYARQMKGGRHV